MGYDYGDFLFDLSKEALKQGQKSSIRQQCDAMRKKAALLSGEEREQVFSAVDACEQAHLQEVESNAAGSTALKEVLKMMSGRG